MWEWLRLAQAWLLVMSVKVLCGWSTPADSIRETAAIPLPGSSSHPIPRRYVNTHCFLSLLSRWDHFWVDTEDDLPPAELEEDLGWQDQYNSCNAVRRDLLVRLYVPLGGQ